MAGLLPADAAETVRKAHRRSAAQVFSGASGTCLSTCFLQPQTWLQSIVCQLITCVGIAIFFGYAQMKTCNIWSCGYYALSEQ